MMNFCFGVAVGALIVLCWDWLVASVTYLKSKWQERKHGGPTL